MSKSDRGTGAKREKSPTELHQQILQDEHQPLRLWRFRNSVAAIQVPRAECLPILHTRSFMHVPA